MCKCTPNIRTPWCGKPGCERPKQETVTIHEEYAWILVKKRTGAIIKTGGVAFESEQNKCPEEILVNPIYSEEYENVRVKITNLSHSKGE